MNEPIDTPQGQNNMAGETAPTGKPVITMGYKLGRWFVILILLTFIAFAGKVLIGLLSG